MLFNLDQANKFMEEYRVYALLATDNTTIKYLGYDIWLSSLKRWNLSPGFGNSIGLPHFCLIPYKEEPVYILNSMSVSFLKDENLSNVISYNIFTDIKNKDKNSFVNNLDKSINKIHKRGIFQNAFEALGFVIKENNLEKSKIAIEETGLTGKDLTNIKKKLKNCNFKNGSEIFRLMRMIKTPEEIEVLAKCSKITEDAMLKAAGEIEAGKYFGVSYSKFKKIIQDYDASFEHYALFPNGLGFTERNDYIIENNKVIAIDAGIIYNSYVSDTAITLFTGKPEKKNFEIYKKLLDILETGFSKVKPGVKCSEVFKAMKAKQIKYNLEDHPVEGHGVGIDCREYPIISGNLGYVYNDGFGNRSADFTIEKNMVINFEGAIQIYNQSYFQIEFTGYVTDEGCKEITRQDRKEPMLRE